MARIVLISPYLKGGKNAAKLAQRTRYVATRPGVELLADERSTLPATKKQRDFITRLLKSFPSCWELIEYEEYLDHPTQGSASARWRSTPEMYGHRWWRCAVRTQSGWAMTTRKTGRLW